MVLEPQVKEEKKIKCVVSSISPIIWPQQNSFLHKTVHVVSGFFFFSILTKNNSNFHTVTVQNRSVTYVSQFAQLISCPLDHSIIYLTVIKLFFFGISLVYANASRSFHIKPWVYYMTHRELDPTCMIIGFSR